MGDTRRLIDRGRATRVVVKALGGAALLAGLTGCELGRPSEMPDEPDPTMARDPAFTPGNVDVEELARRVATIRHLSFQSAVTARG